MSPTTSPRTPWRALRAVVGATVSTAAAVGVHAFAGGQVKVPVALALLIGATFIGASITTKRVSASQLLGLLVVTQASVHLACAVDDPTVGGWQMLAAHGAATLLSAVALSRAERWAWGLAEALATCALRIVQAIAVPVIAVRTVTPVIAVPTGQQADRFVLLRGPPVAA